MEINWTIVIIALIVSFTMTVIVNYIKEIKIASITKDITKNMDVDDIIKLGGKK